MGEAPAEGQGELGGDLEVALGVGGLGDGLILEELVVQGQGDGGGQAQHLSVGGAVGLEQVEQARGVVEAGADLAGPFGFLGILVAAERLGQADLAGGHCICGGQRAQRGGGEVGGQVLGEAPEAADQVQRPGLAEADLQVGGVAVAGDHRALAEVGLGAGEVGRQRAAIGAEAAVGDAVAAVHAAVVGGLVEHVGGVVALVVDGHVPGDVGEVLRQQGHRLAHAHVVGGVQGLSGGDVLDVAVVGDAEGGDAGEHLVADGHVDRGASGEAVEGAVAELDVAAELMAGLLQGDQDGAAGGVPAEQSALGSVEHLQLVDAEEGEVVGVLSGDVDVVDIGADLGLEGGEGLGLSEAADVVDVGGGLADVVGGEQVGDLSPEIQRAGDLSGGERGGVEAGD